MNKFEQVLGHQRLLSYALSAGLLLSSALAHAVEFKEGEWELTVKQSVKGMPVGVPAVSWRECLTQANPIPTRYLQARSCDVIEQNAVYRTLHYKINCFTENGSMINEGKVRFGEFKLSGDSKSELADVAGRDMVLRYKFEGRRIGECK